MNIGLRLTNLRVEQYYKCLSFFRRVSGRQPAKREKEEYEKLRLTTPKFHTLTSKNLKVDFLLLKKYFLKLFKKVRLNKLFITPSECS